MLLLLLCSYSGVVGQQRDNNEMPHHPSEAIHKAPLEDPPWTNAGMGFNLTISGTVECGESITVGYCWSCARCEGSNPCDMASCPKCDIVQC